MIQNVIRDMGGIAVYGIISVCLFFAVFTGAIVWALLQRRSLCEKMRALPLHDGSVEGQSGNHSDGARPSSRAAIPLQPIELKLSGAAPRTERTSKRKCCGACGGNEKDSHE